MSSSPRVIIYRYDASPYSIKVDNVLVLKKIPHQKVNVSPVLPRPEITDLLGVTYRRIPILAIGNDVYCDTSLIVSALERRFPASAGYGTIFPQAKNGGGAVNGLAKASANFFENALFPAAANLLPWEKFPPAFIKDRSLLSGTTFRVEAIAASRETSLNTLSAHLSLLEEQFQDGREWLFDTELPSLTDISIHFILNWVRASRLGRPLVDATNFPKTVKWLAHFSDYLERERGGQAAAQQITGEEAAASIMASSFESYDVVGFNTTEAARLALKLNEQVQIAPDDTGRKYLTVGKLVGINMEEVVIEVQGFQGLVRCHFPRLGFTLKAVRSHKL
ncbi:hypothetical protein D9615_000378 [Tricholomella constricta]|uniref:GST N-terminal domain-containing protein n=1 Tax=Tricholomella constricta TaxID=117010 RepID=A0A8H5HQY5_9AGAR|nr:hypothetical protein D9615_000378 [Tricholomella constricta]